MKLCAAALAASLAVPAMAATPLAPEIAGAGFLVGTWRSDDGVVADAGQTSKGTSIISVEADGHALLRRDHTVTFDKSGKAAEDFSQVMLITPGNGTLMADYADGGGHVIHYVSATIISGKSVVLKSAPGAGPVFQLGYELKAPDTLTVTFGMIPPGQTELHAIAQGTLHRQP